MTHSPYENLIAAARAGDLYGFMLRVHADDVTHEGKYLRLKSNHHVVIKAGFNGFFDNETGESGNPIDFLMKYYGYPFKDALFALTGGEVNAPKAADNPAGTAVRDVSDVPEWNKPTKDPFKKVFAYLIKERGIPADVVTMLCKSKKLYQDNSGNCVFYDEAEKVREIRGTNSRAETKFRPIYRPSKEAFWSFGADNPDWIYVCEAAIDAISVYVLCGKPANGRFVSMAGCENQAIIDRLKATGKTVIICTDNDAAGQKVRDKNPECPFCIPRNKDFNDDLRSLNRKE